MSDADDNPPHSRLFITGTFSTDEDAFRKDFGKYGKVENVIFIKEKDSGKSKGISFVKFSKASEAAIAMEAMNHTSVLDCFRPITVKIAQDKSFDGVASRILNDDDRIMRLFIIMPPNEDEDSVRAHFSQFGQIRKVALIPDKHRRGTHSPRTFAFIKFYKASDAAKAFEECDSRYKAVFAKAQIDTSQDDNDNYGGRQRSSSGRYAERDSNKHKRLRDYDDDNYSHNKQRGGGMNSNMMQNNLAMNPLMLMMMNKMSNNPFFSQDMMKMPNVQFSAMGTNNAMGGELIVKTKIPTNVSNLAQLFNVVPGMESCVPDMRSNGTIFNVNYTTPRAASYAYEKLQGFEYPPGMPLAIVCNNFPTENSNYMNPSIMTNFMNPSDMFGSSMMDNGGDNMNMMMMNSNGNNGGSGGMMGFGESESNNMMTSLNHGGMTNSDPMHQQSGANEGGNYCNVPLPPPQPMGPKNEPTKERLWVMGYPKIPPVAALLDTFGRFGNLLAVVPSKDRNYCFVHYGDFTSARNAKSTLDKSVICGMEMKVVVAEPQTSTRGADESAYQHLNQQGSSR